MAIPRCRVMLAEDDTISRLTLRDLMDELPDELYDFELEDARARRIDLRWLVAAGDDDLDAA
ncbi:MAG TPA: hypothetical protein VGL23_10330 [Chloroflexota bacterium]